MWNKIQKKLFDLLKKETPFNYLYFGSFAFILLTLSIFHVLSIETFSWKTKVYFACLGFCQTLLQITSFFFVSVLLKSLASRFIYYFFIGLTFVFLFMEAIEIVLVKIMDVSLLDAYHVAFGADLVNFIEVLYLSDIGIVSWITIFALVAIFPLLGIFLYKASSKVALKKPIVFKQRYFVALLFLLPLFLLIMDFSIPTSLARLEFGKFKKALPFKRTFFNEKSEAIAFKKPFAPKRLQSEILKELDEQDLKKAFLPNIYLFVSESLREDYITSYTAPNLTQFKKEGISSSFSLSNANCTNISWFSIFHAQYPFYWSYKETPRWKEGSLPLNILKKMGYKIHLYSSAQLKFYKSDEVIFGKNRALATTYKDFPHYGDTPACESDEATVNAFLSDFQSTPEKEGNVYIFFWDSTHFNYSWPKDFHAKFKPAAEITWGHRLSHDPKKLDEIKNRYRNSISYVDFLFAKCLKAIREKGVYDDSVIVFCGDHGEEFKEEGKLFHASNLNLQQTLVPIYYKLGKQKLEKSYEHRVSSHIDIFPTILHYVDEKSERCLSYFDGHSILSDAFPKYTYVARYNACNNSSEFFIHDGFEYLTMKFSNERNIFKSRSLKVLRLHQGKVALPITKKEALYRYKSALEPVFSLKTN